MIWAAALGVLAAGQAESSMDVYVTGQAGKAFSHVRITLDRIELTNGLTTSVVFDRAAFGAATIDLEKLHDKAGSLFYYLGSQRFPTGLFPTLVVTMENPIEITPRGAAQSLRATLNADPESFRFDLAKAHREMPGPGFVLDFDASQWRNDGKAVTAKKGKLVSAGDESGIYIVARHLEQTFQGPITKLSGEHGSQSFQLMMAGQPLIVQLASSTKVPDADLGEGQVVKVTGRFDPADEALEAEVVESAKAPSGETKSNTKEEP